MTNTAEVFERDRYVVIPSLLQEPSLTKLYDYARSVSALLAARSPGDSQVPGTPSSYGDFMLDGLLVDLLPEVERATGLALFPTYSYFRMYKHGDALAKHTDRPACEISVTLCLGFEAEKPWPIWIDGPQGESSVCLEPGDGLIYRGTECPHWRAEFEGTRQAQVFLHYVDQKGPCADWKFDKRLSLAGLPPALDRVLHLENHE